MSGKKLLKDFNPELLKEWDFEKNGELDPQTVSRSLKEAVWWICLKDHRHSWKSPIKHRVFNNSGCHYCAGKLVLREESFAAKHPDLMDEWDWDKNKELDPYSLSCASNVSAFWKCKNNSEHTWKADIYHRSYHKTGCRKCSDQSREKRKPKKLLIDAFPQIAKDWDYTKNADIDISSITHASSKKVWWKCSIDPTHEWQASVGNRTSAHRSCPYCSEELPSSKNSLESIYPAVAAEWHYNKNFPLKPSEVTRASGKKVWWICSYDPEHEWEAVIRNRTTLGSGCPICDKELKPIRLLGYMLDNQGSLSAQYKIFAKSLYSIESILKEINFSKDSYTKAFLRLSYSFVITSLETYLSDIFSEKVVGDEMKMDDLFRYASEFKDRKFSIEDVLSFNVKKSATAEEFIQEIIWHNIPKVSYLYRKVLKLEFDKELIPSVSKHISVRHDIVHRNGRKKNGDIHNMDIDAVNCCILDVKNFVNKIELEIKSLNL